MPRFELAHLNEQSVDLIIIPLEQSFGYKGIGQKNDIRDQLQLRAQSAGLRGTVVPVWDAGGGRMGFLAPRSFQPFFQSIGLNYVYSNLNRELSW